MIALLLASAGVSLLTRQYDDAISITLVRASLEPGCERRQAGPATCDRHVHAAAPLLSWQDHGTISRRPDD